MEKTQICGNNSSFWRRAGGEDTLLKLSQEILMLEALALRVAFEEPPGNMVKDLRLLSFERIEPKHCNFFSRLSEGIVEDEDLVD